MDPEIVDLPMNKTRRKFLRLLMSSRAEFLQFDTPEEVMQLTDNDLLRGWYWMHVSNTRGAGDPR